jgi:SET domain-containing protein
MQVFMACIFYFILLKFMCILYCNIPYDVLGITHVEDKRFENGYIRTPLGAFFNHSDNPNCEAFKFQDFIMLKVIKPVKAGEELTAYYWLYDLEEKNERS